jgi:hypothetical protein
MVTDIFRYGGLPVRAAALSQKWLKRPLLCAICSSLVNEYAAEPELLFSVSKGSILGISKSLKTGRCNPLKWCVPNHMFWYGPLGRQCVRQVRCIRLRVNCYQIW